MTNLQNFPSSPNTSYLKATRIIEQLENAIKGKEDSNAVIAGVHNCIKCGTPAVKIISEIKEMAHDNYNMTASFFGGALVDTIQNFA